MTLSGWLEAFGRRSGSWARRRQSTRIFGRQKPRSKPSPTWRRARAAAPILGAGATHSAI